MGNTPVPVITEAGMTKPLFSECLTYFEDLFKGIYGQDLYWEPDDRDQQFMAQLAEALDDTNSSILAVFNGFSPTSAQKVSLSRLVKINGIARLAPGYSSADVVIGGQTGTVIVGGMVRDDEGYLWSLPDEVIIPASGQIVATAVCNTLGAIRAPAGTITEMATLVAGWQTVNNPADADVGAPVESDAYLRARQAMSTALPSETVIDKLRGAVAGLSGVSKSRIYENDGPVADEYNIPPHSIAVVVSGGGSISIANAIAQGKGSGVRTHGSASQTFVGTSGVPQVIKYSRPRQVPITIQVTVQGLRGFTVDVQNEIKKALVEWINAMDMGDHITRMDAVIPARLSDTKYVNSFRIKEVLIARGGTSPAIGDIDLAYDEEAYCALSYVTVRLAP